VCYTFRLDSRLTRLIEFDAGLCLLVQVSIHDTGTETTSKALLLSDPHKINKEIYLWAQFFNP